jgi:hypothetical protein
VYYTAQGLNWLVCSLESTSDRRLLNSVAGVEKGPLPLRMTTCRDRAGPGSGRSRGEGGKSAQEASGKGRWGSAGLKMRS